MISKKISEGYVLAVVPVVGIAAITTYRMGYYLFFDVPLKFLEISTANTVLTGISFGVYVFVGMQSFALLYDYKEELSGFKRYVQHILAASYLTFPTWAGDIGFNSEISWPTIAFIVFCAFVTNSFENLYSEAMNKKVSSFWQWVGSMSLASFLIFWLLIFALAGLGMSNAKNEKSRDFISGTNYFIVGSYGDSLIAKEYFAKSKTFNKEKTLIVPLSEKIIIEERSAPIAKK